MAQQKDCYCATCDQEFHHLGIASHRAAHRRRNQNCQIVYSTGKRIVHVFNADEHDP